MPRLIRRNVLAALLTSVVWSAAASPAAAQVLFVGTTTGAIRKHDSVTGAYLGDFATLSDLSVVGGMAYGPNGHLFVAHRTSTPPDSGRVSELNPITGALIGTFDPGVPLHGLAFTATGEMLVTSYATGNIRRVDLSTGASTPFASTVEPTGIAVAANGDVFVSSLASNNLTRFSPTGVPLGTLNTGRYAPDLTFGPDGFLYAPVESLDIVLRVNPLAMTASTFVTAGQGGLESPYGVSFGYDGNLYVSAGHTAGYLTVKEYDGLTGAFLGDFIPPTAGVTPTNLLFSQIPVPEPSSLLLAGAATAALVRLCRRRPECAH